MEEIKKKSKKRSLIYVLIVGGLITLTLGMFSFANYYKARLKSSDSQVLASKNILDTIGWDAVEDETSIYHDKALWYNDIYVHFTKESKTNSAVYITSAVFAYTFSILSLVSFGLVLKDADKQKAKEDKVQ